MEKKNVRVAKAGINVGLLAVAKTAQEKEQIASVSYARTDPSHAAKLHKAGGGFKREMREMRQIMLLRHEFQVLRIEIKHVRVTDTMVHGVVGGHVLDFVDLEGLLADGGVMTDTHVTIPDLNLFTYTHSTILDDFNIILNFVMMNQ